MAQSHYYILCQNERTCSVSDNNDNNMDWLYCIGRSNDRSIEGMKKTEKIMAKDSGRHMHLFFLLIHSFYTRYISKYYIQDYMAMTVEQFLRSSSSVYYYYYFSFMKNDATQQFVVCSRFFFSQSDSSNFIEKRTTWFSSRWRLNNLYITQPNFSFLTSILGSLPCMNCEFSYIVLFWYSYVQVAILRW